MNLTHTYNNRLQPNEFKASSTSGNAIDITYNFVDPVSGKNAGHVYGITNNLDATRSQNFAYDQLNRITSALTTSTYATSPAHCWGENYTLDSWGNLNSIAATTNSAYTGCTIESGFSTTAGGNNHLPIFGYDPSGNTTSDGFVTNYQWDAESQLKSAAGTTYNYDGDGRRVSKVGSKLYWYGSGGDILAETDTCGNTTAEYIFFGGKRIAMIPWSGANCSSTGAGNASYYVEDLLGTSRVLTTNAGVVCYDADFYPYGGERAYTNTCPQNYKFEGKERDTETGNDDFGARYYSNRFGRWLSADWSSVPVPVPYANLTNPQTLNLYSMVADDPESFADLDGHTYRQAYQVANPAASSAWDPGGVVDSMTNDSGLTDEEVNSLNSFRAAEAAQQQVQNQATPQSLRDQIPGDVRTSLAGMIKDSDSPTADDKKGGFHEEYAVAGLNASGGWVVSRDKPGPYANPDTADHVSPSGKPENREVANSIVDPRVAAHVHPSGATATHTWKQPPSPADRAAAVPGQINIVFGARDRKVYFYNNAGDIGKPMKLKDFLRQ